MFLLSLFSAFSSERGSFYLSTDLRLETVSAVSGCWPITGKGAFTHTLFLYVMDCGPKPVEKRGENCSVCIPSHSFVSDLTGISFFFSKQFAILMTLLIFLVYIEITNVILVLCFKFL